VPVIYPVNVLNNRLQQVVNAIDAGVTNGFLKLIKLGGAVVASFQLARPCGTITGGVLTFSGTLVDPVAAGGLVSGGLIADGDGNTVVSGLLLNTEIFLSPTPNINPGQTVTITSATITGN
jgi:hypothetical protein